MTLYGLSHPPSALNTWMRKKKMKHGMKNVFLGLPHENTCLGVFGLLWADVTKGYVTTMFQYTAEQEIAEAEPMGW